MANSANFVPVNWEVRPLEELTESKNISYGIVQPGSNDPKGIPIIRVNNFSSNGLDTSNVLKVSPEIEKKFSKTRLRLGDVLLTLVGSTGQTYVVPDKYVGWNVPRAVAVIRPNSIVSSEWIKICLDSQYTKHFLDSRANTTVQKTLNLSDIKKIPIPIPPKKERAFIETCAVDLDKKLNLNSEVNQTLEQMAQALFKSWFVDFDPVIDNALAAGSEIPDALQHRVEIRKKAHALQKQNPNIQPLPAATQRLFPSEFEHCGDTSMGVSGWIPIGWRVEKFPTGTEFREGPGILAKDFHDEGIPLIRLAGLKNGVSLLDGCNFLDPVKVNQKWSHFKLQEGDILLSSSASLGRVAEVDKSAVGAVAYTGIISFRPIQGITNRRFLRHFLQSNVFQNQVVMAGVGSVLNHFGPTHIKNMSIFIPNIEVQNKFSDLVTPSDKAISERLKHSSTLSNMRDTLLPKLISGQLKLSE